MRRLLLTLFLASAACFSFAELPPQLPVGDQEIAIFISSLSNDTLEGLPLAITFSSGETSFFDFREIPADKRLLFLLDSGAWTAVGEIDSKTTPGKDYFASTTLTARNSSSYVLFLENVGSVKVTVKAGEKPISGVELTASCVSQFYSFQEMNGRVYTDSNGEALLLFVPTGRCTISANSTDFSGSKSVNVAQGGLTEENIELIEKNSPVVFPWLIAVCVLIALVVITLFYLYKQRKAHLEHHVVKTAEPAKTIHKTVEKTGAVSFLKALDENERRIVEALKENRRLKQSVLFKKLLIPKTTLIRTVQKLERKKIVFTTPIGNTRWVELEKWFKNKL